MAGDARTSLVRLLKVALPLTAAGLIAAVFLMPRPDAGLDLGGLRYDVGEGLRLSSPRFTGATPDGRPFEVIADWALPDGPDPTSVALGPLRGEIGVDDDRSATLTATGGEIRPKDETVRLDGPVTLRSTDGWRLTAAEARVDVAGETLEADGPVSGAGPAGTIEAGAMRAARREESHYVWFERGVRVTIDPDRID